MKKTKYIFMCLLAAGVGLTSTSCTDYLSTEQYFSDIESIDHIFNDKESTMEWMSFAYSRLQGDNLEIGHSDVCPTNYSDDMTFNEGSNGKRYRAFKLGEIGYGYDNSWSGWYANTWPWSYAGIRQVSILLNEIHTTVELNQQEIDDLKGQAYFLRGYFYWLLIRKYGPVPLMPRETMDYAQTYDELSMPRNSWDECVDFIVEEMESAAKLLEEKRGPTDVARPTKGAALAVRAKVLTYAASPLYNGNTDMADFVDSNGRQLIPQEYKAEKWARAAAACRDMIEYSEATGNHKLLTKSLVENAGAQAEAYPATIKPPYNAEYSEKNFPEGWADIDPFDSYRSVFNGEYLISENPEIIFCRGRNGDKSDLSTGGGVDDLVRHQLPIEMGGWNIHGITQKQCDAYDMADGTPFNRDEALAPFLALDIKNKMFTSKNNKDLHAYDNVENDVWVGYCNREPRFYASVAYSGRTWFGLSYQGTNTSGMTNKKVHYYSGQTSGYSTGNERCVNTGIGVYKYVHPDDNANENSSITSKTDPAIRYADILLLYAEALNNVEGTVEVKSWDGTKTYTITRDEAEMHHGVKPVRMRAGVPDYTPEVYADKEKFQEAIVHERQIEFFAENQRYFDLRRWKIAEQHEGEQIYGCNVYMTKNERENFYTPVRVPNLQTSFSRKQYFWPITYTELKRNKNMTQAPGWETYD